MKTRYFLSSALLALTTVGCTDLDVEIKSQYTEYPNSEIALEAKTNNAYYALEVPWVVAMMKVYPAIRMNIRLSASIQTT